MTRFGSVHVPAGDQPRRYAEIRDLHLPFSTQEDVASLNVSVNVTYEDEKMSNIVMAKLDLMYLEILTIIMQVFKPLQDFFQNSCDTDFVQDSKLAGGIVFHLGPYNVQKRS